MPVNAAPSNASLVIPTGLVILCASLGFFISTVGSQELYRWMDEKGTVHFTDSLHSVPEQYREQAQKRMLPSSPQPLPEAAKSRGTAPGQRILIPFTRQRNHMVVDGFVNERGPVKFIVDTGAEGTTVSRSMAQQVGLDPARGIPIPVGGVGGAVLAPLVQIDSLKVGEAEVRNIEVTIQDLPGFGEVGLLGMNFLAAFRMNINQSKSELTLEPDPEGAHEGRPLNWWQIAFRFWHRVKRDVEQFRSNAQLPSQREQAESALRTVESRILDLETRASQAGVPRELRQ